MKHSCVILCDICMIQDGMNIRTVGLLWQRYQQTGDIRERHTGSTRATQPVYDMLARLQALRNPNVTASQLRSGLQNIHRINVSTQTVRNRLHEGNLYARRPIGVSVLSRGNRTRLEWAEEHQIW